MVIIVCLMVIMFVVIGIYVKSEDFGKLIIVIIIMIFVLIVMVLFVIVLIVVFVFCKRYEWFIVVDIKDDVVEKFKGKFLWFFSFGIIMKNVLELVINIDCLNKELSKKFVLVFMVVYIVFILYFCI